MRTEDARRHAWRPIADFEPNNACEYKHADGAVSQGRSVGRRTDCFMLYGTASPAAVTHFLLI